MPFNFSAAHSSRITKKSQHRSPLLKRSSSSAFADLNRRKPLSRSKSKPERLDDEDDFFGDRLEDDGIVKSLAADLSLRDVAQTIQYVRSHMFDALPEGGGFNSTRIAEILNFRKSLPPCVTVPHIHALTGDPTTTEREIAELTKTNIIKRVLTPGRGTGGSSVGEGLILMKDFEQLTREEQNLDEKLSDHFLHYLHMRPMAQSVPSTKFSQEEVTALMRAGLLTTSSRGFNSASVFASPDASVNRTNTFISSISRAASGSVAAVGGDDAVHSAGGRAGIRSTSSQFDRGGDLFNGQELKLSLPGTGAYLRLLTEARSRLVILITKSRFREVPLYLLKERWEGGISADDPAAKAKKYRGEFTGVLPSRTRKWKQFYGLSFDWVLAECVGGGLVELFETGSVGRAVRIC
ncbi:hypothetical protein MMC21_004627 [Puttea exsequens]|nr:hypothetical protein [Puttea exsequens]